MAQPKPTYPSMTTVQSRVVLDRIEIRHGPFSACWPVIFYNSEKLTPSWLTFEINQNNSTNTWISQRFFQRGQLEEYAINYLPPKRYIRSLTQAAWPDPPGEEIVNLQYSSTYDYVMSLQNSIYNTIDLDYVWRTRKDEYRGLELSTFWSPMSSFDYAKYLVDQFIKKRPAIKNAHQFTILADVAEMQDINLRLVFVNVLGKGSNEINTEGNVFVIPINRDNARRMHMGQFPKDYHFRSCRDWLKSL